MKKILVAIFVVLISHASGMAISLTNGTLKKITQQSCIAMTSIRKNSSDMKAGDIYQHYKGKKYQIIAPVAYYSEEQPKPTSEFVVYKALYTAPEYGKNAVWVRPAGMFKESVMIDGKNVLRFKKVDPSDIGSLAEDISFWANISNSLD